MYMCVRNIYVVSVPCEWSCICLSGISMLSLFLVSGHVYSLSGISMLSLFLVSGHVYVSGISMLSLFLVSGHVYVCQEYRCCLCSL